MAEIGLDAAAYAEIGVEAMLAGDIARAVGAFASIGEESWQALAARFPGFPLRQIENWPLHALPGHGPAGALEPAFGSDG